MPLPDDISSLPSIRQAKELLATALRTVPGVVGVGVGVPGAGLGATIKIYVEQVTPALMVTIPSIYAGIPTTLVAVGRLRAHAARGGRYRPLRPGASIGHMSVTAGTLGGLVKDRSTGKVLILSNNHILAAEDTGGNRAQAGDEIRQPGNLDGGSEPVARLVRWVPLKPSGQGVNYVDCAIAEPLVEVDPHPIDLQFLPEGARNPAPGEEVVKSGRTTQVTTGEVIDLDVAAFNIEYGGFTADFDHQIMTTGMSLGGDSGSFLYSSDGRYVVGLLFAGGDSATLYNPVGNVASALNIEFPNWASQAATIPAPTNPTPSPRGSTRGTIIETQIDGSQFVETRDRVTPTAVIGLGLIAIGAAFMLIRKE